MPISQEVIDRLLIAKDFLEKIRVAPTSLPNRHTLAQYILSSHDAAELALAAVAHHLGALPKSQEYLMNYVSEIEKRTGEAVPGKTYFSQLNRVRSSIKHEGIFPEPQQWHRVGEKVYDHVTEWCEKYLGLSFPELDESALIADPSVRGWLEEAREAYAQKDFKGALEKLALAMTILFHENGALRNIPIGESRAEDAIKLATFGVPANDYLVLQYFMPRVSFSNAGPTIRWEQYKFGHPANWTDTNLKFCLRTFVNLAVRIQDAQFIPAPIYFDWVYWHKVTALEDDVQIVGEQRESFLASPKKIVARTLRKGESIYGNVQLKEISFSMLLQGSPVVPVIEFGNHAEKLYGEIEAKRVKVTCVPLDEDWTKKNFPDLPEIDFIPNP